MGRLTPNTSLRRRVGALVKFSQGEPIGHRGGRYLWQLAGCQALLVAWMAEPYCAGLEDALLGAFEGAHGQLPFANHIRDHRGAPRPPWWDAAIRDVTGTTGTRSNADT
jgi:hypothetical protein